MAEGDYEDREQNGSDFASYVLKEWLDTSELGKKFRMNILSKRHADSETYHMFIVNLCNLWLQLEPEVRGHQFKTDDLEKRFFEFEKIRLDPQRVLEVQKDLKDEEALERQELLFKMEEVIRIVIYELKITRW